MTKFAGVHAALEQALIERGYEKLTPVQHAVLAPELQHGDALVSAQTGSGKTVAFGLALAPTLLADEERFGRAQVPLALTIAPTRELALQVKRELEWLYAKTGAKVTSCVGGMDMRSERRALQNGAHIVVGTPGRLRDHIERGSFDTSGVLGVVLDEADEMLDLGFRDDLEYILDSMPKDRRTLMFSATVPRSIASLAKRYQNDAVRISTQAETKQHVDIEYRALTVAPNDRENAIINVLRHVDSQNTIIFCATRATVNHMTSRLNNRGFSVVALSGELSQNERTHALQSMRDGRARVCVATDVAARGIDLPNLDLVIHADIPKNKESLLHRSGRTGRAGRKGTCVLIVPHNWRKRTERLLQNARIEATWAKPPSLDEVAKMDRERILSDEGLTRALSDEEQVFAQELLARHSAEHIANAYIQLHTAGQPAPEELLDSGPVERPQTTRNDFKNGVWFSMSVGRKHTAEARWLLPMLCRAGHVTKREIGAIRIHHDETHVELEPGCVDRFLEALGPSRKVEKTITVTRLNGVPPEPKDSAKDGRGRQYSKRKSSSEKQTYRRDKTSHDKKPYRPKCDKFDDAGAETSSEASSHTKSYGARKVGAGNASRTDSRKDSLKDTRKDSRKDTRKDSRKDTRKDSRSDSGQKPARKKISANDPRRDPTKKGPKRSGAKTAKFSKGSDTRSSSRTGSKGKAGSSPLRRKTLKIKGK